MKVYDYSLDFNDGSANGLHCYGTGLNSEEAVDLAARTALGTPSAELYYEFTNDDETEGAIWTSEKARQAKAVPIGKFSIRVIPN